MAVVSASLSAQLCRSPGSCLLVTALHDSLLRLLVQFGSADNNLVYLILFLLTYFPCGPVCSLPLYKESKLRVSGSSL